ncbi:MAG: hypothetical protein M3O50_16345 [Myxococcota bacterium]|nr:hypothetical protein [Myxococcota bacterium]
MLKFEFVVTGTELTDLQKKRITSDFPALVSKALATEDAGGFAAGPPRFWCLCKVNGRSMLEHGHCEEASDRGAPAPNAERPSTVVSAGAAAERAEVLVFEIV